VLLTVPLCPPSSPSFSGLPTFWCLRRRAILLSARADEKAKRSTFYFSPVCNVDFVLSLYIPLFLWLVVAVFVCATHDVAGG
jgi:hypothetical protein